MPACQNFMVDMIYFMGKDQGQGQALGHDHAVQQFSHFRPQGWRSCGVEETGAAQHYRDIRIGAIYEGTNGIQAADLVGRKLPMRGGGVVLDHLASLDVKAKDLAALEGMSKFAANLEAAVASARSATGWLLEHGSSDINAALAGSSPYLRMLGTVVCGGLMADLAMKADLSGDPDFAEAKKVSARFFGEQILPTAAGLLGAVTAGADDLFALSAEQLA